VHVILKRNSSAATWCNPLLDWQTRPRKLEYLVFEFGSELQSITDSPFARLGLTLLFLPPTVRFICQGAFSDCSSVACVHFGHQSSLRQLSRWVFPGLSLISAVTIPSSVKRIQSDAFNNCCCLRIVKFEFPSQCWSICFDIFQNCRLLEPKSQIH
jgi:hypothetical protein